MGARLRWNDHHRRARKDRPVSVTPLRTQRRSLGTERRGLHPAATPEPTGKRPPASLPHALTQGGRTWKSFARNSAHLEQICARPRPSWSCQRQDDVPWDSPSRPETGPGPWIPTAQGTFHIVHRGAIHAKRWGCSHSDVVERLLHAEVPP